MQEKTERNSAQGDCTAIFALTKGKQARPRADCTPTRVLARCCREVTQAPYQYPYGTEYHDCIDEFGICVACHKTQYAHPSLAYQKQSNKISPSRFGTAMNHYRSHTQLLLFLSRRPHGKSTPTAEHQPISSIPCEKHLPRSVELLASLYAFSQVRALSVTTPHVRLRAGATLKTYTASRQNAI